VPVEWDTGHTQKLLFLNKAKNFFPFETEGNEVRMGSHVNEMCRCGARKLRKFVLDVLAFLSDVGGIYWMANKCQTHTFPNIDSIVNLCS
jgi:hypothetical protein